jgi:hypothetical protein
MSRIVIVILNVFIVEVYTCFYESFKLYYLFLKDKNENLEIVSNGQIHAKISTITLQNKQIIRDTTT